MTPNETKIEVDLSRRPLVVTTFYGLPDDDEFERYLETLANNLRYAIERREKTALVLDTTHSPTPVSAKQRRMQAEWLTDHEAALRAGCDGMAFAIQSSLVRGAMTAVLWLQRLPYEYTVVSTREQGEAWCIERLQRLGQQVPAPAPPINTTGEH